ncbi:testin [Eucyclogobius newberryi]|uniref:testin n=1 Tax=Eucyclogobius newberryi TaxID=166745 RepID=UPI003B5983DD
MEIEREVKKMTLGHEFGAGALCLKCKDKCEGFELHFWRKICRNCKCGLTEHDVQMNSEQDKRVGKLFEDTKYTGLIAKLKRDGIPGQQSNMSLTISVPVSSMAQSVPASALASSAYSSGYSSVSSSTGSIPGAVASGGSAPGSGPGFGGPGSTAGSGSGLGAGAGGPGSTAGSRSGFGAGAGGPGSGLGAGAGGPGSTAGSRSGFGAGAGSPGAGGPGSTAGSGFGAGAGGPGSTAGSGSGLGAGAGGPGSTAGSGSGFGAGAGGPGSAGRGPGGAGAPGLGAGGISLNLTPVRASAVPVSAVSSAAAVQPVPKDAAMKSVTFEWAPPVANKHVAIRYIELLPPERRPIAGTAGAAYRRQQMARQLPEHDQDPDKCHELSPAEVKQMQQYVRKYKDEALGVGDVSLPQDVALAAGRGELGPGGPGSGGPGSGGPGSGGPGSGGPGSGGPGSGGPGSGLGSGLGGGGGSLGTAAAAGALAAGAQQNFTCHQCHEPMRVGDPAVYAERAGYDKMWHPGCFVCVTCSQLLVDMIYFWKKGKMFCGRHYGDSEKPRCAGCDELIFSNEYTQAEGQDWHLKHFCCFDCDCVLAGETYVMENDKPVCKPCYMNNYAMKCASCHSPIEPEAQRVSYGAHCWHAQPECFLCSGCSQCLMGKRFMAVQNHLFCSVDCKKKVVT